MDSLVSASFIKNRRTTLERIEKFISNLYFTDVNLHGKLYPERRSIDDISHWKLPGEEGAWQNWKVENILQQEFQPTRVGNSFGPSWSTHWFKLCFNVPDSWAGQEIRLRWKSQSEAMLWDQNGNPLQGFSTGTAHQVRTDYCLSKNWKQSEDELLYFVEMSCSRMFGVGKNGMISPPNPNVSFTLETVEIAVFDRKVYSLLMDLESLHALANNMAEDQRGYRALYAGNQIVNFIIEEKYEEANKVSATFFSKSGGQLANTLALIGNCHIDSAWLWPFSEAKRKCARSWSSTLLLMDTYEDMVFAASQAQQFTWVKEFYPELFNRISDSVKNGKFTPVGSTWVEMDGLIPSGESFMRQFLYGQTFFQKEFGKPCKEFWLPDTFGYSGQIPQICQHFDISRFLTQKLSWSLVNKFPHHTFIWEGIDGSSVLAHFPPGDSYELNIKVDEIVRTETNLRDKGRTSTSAFLYGFGDGGGGPTEDMLERARRLSNLDGLPRLIHTTPDEFFSTLEKEKGNLCKWVGELYLELHNGTYTSQANTKRLNRTCEFAARTAEMLLAVSALKKSINMDEIKRLQTMCESAWKKVLLNQFHDVLPGSSIGMVYKDSTELFMQALDSFEQVQEKCLDVLLMKSMAKEEELSLSILNPLSWEVSQVVEVQDDSHLAAWDGLTQKLPTGKKYVSVIAPALSCSPLKPLTVSKVSIEMQDNQFVLENQYLKVIISPYGEILTLANIFGTSGSPDAKGNLITFYDDVPLFWDAWDIMDYHLETRKILNCQSNAENITPVTVKLSGPLVTQLEWSLKIGSKSTMTQIIELSSASRYITFKNTIDWHESHKLLKVEFDTRLLARSASYEIQFGHVNRPTHMNTSWDSARFEVCGHKWADISEYGAGLAVLNDSKYGLSALGGRLSLSLLRSPKSPDDQCDMGQHTFKYAAMPHAGNFREAKVVQAAYEFNSPLVPSLSNLQDNKPWFSMYGSDNIVLEAVKVSEENPSAIIFRLYEMNGGSHSAKLCISGEYGSIEAAECNGLEQERKRIQVEKDQQNASIISLDFAPFEIKTIKVNLK